MTKLVWDQVGSRKFETGCDRGVLYLPNGSAVPWNGLTSVDEDLSAVTVSEYYLDGVKYLNDRSLGDFAGTINAFTYPDEFRQFDGMGEISSGMFASDQPVTEKFGLSYRTRIGNDELGTEYGYKIHLLYNLTSKPANKTFSSISDKSNPIDLSWSISGVPIPITGFRPTCHIVVDSTRVHPGIMTSLENILYGTSSTAPSLPDAATLISLNSGSDTITALILEPL